MTGDKLSVIRLLVLNLTFCVNFTIFVLFEVGCISSIVHFNHDIFISIYANEETGSSNLLRQIILGKLLRKMRSLHISIFRPDDFFEK